MTGQTVSVLALPRALRWLVPAPGYELGDDGALTIRAGALTDWFIDPGTGATTRNAPALVMPTNGAWQLSAVVSADLQATFDAGVLFVYVDDEHWAKLCLERSPGGEIMVVSVVTRGTSDDCNSVTVDGHSLRLRISRLEGAFAFHYSAEGQRWHLVRYFSLGADDALDMPEVGVMAQSPTGEGCSATFRDIVFRPELLRDLRSGV